MRHLSGPGCLLPPAFCLPGAFLPNPRLVSGRLARGAQPWAATLLGPGGNAGILLLVRERVAVTAGGGGDTCPPAPLPRRPRVLRFGIAASELFAAAHIPHVVAAAATFPAFLQNRITTFS